MNISRLALPLLLLPLVSVGCGSKAELETCRAEVSDLELKLAALEADNTLLQEQAQQYSDRFFSYVEALPSEYQALELEVEERLDEQLEQFDETTRQQIREQFDALRAGLGQQFGELQSEIRTLRTQSAGTQRDVQGARDQLTEIQRMAELDVEELREKTRTTATLLHSLVTNIQNWDSSRIHCRKKSDCPETLTLNKEESLAVSTFHDQLIQELTSIQAEL